MPTFLTMIVAALLLVASAYAQGLKCHLSTSESCALNSFPVGKSVQVFPVGGPDTPSTPVCLHGAPYSFQVIRGTDKSKLLVHFQGGGACWDEASLALGACSSTAEPVPNEGIFDKRSLKNRYRSYTVISILYCSGDIHMGNYDWSSIMFGKIYQRGQVNVQIVLKYIQKQINAGHIQKNLDSLMLTGSSAGSLGLQMWSGHLLRTLPKRNRVAVVPDSLAGVFPTNSVAPLLKNYGACDLLTQLTPALATLTERCLRGNVSVETIFLSNMREFPKVPFTFIQSKEDAIQLEFYDGVDLTNLLENEWLDGAGFYGKTLDFLTTYNARPNWLIYFIPGDTHEFLTKKWFYQASVLGSNAGRTAIGVPMLYNWIAALPLDRGKNISTQGAPVGYQGKSFVQK